MISALDEHELETMLGLMEKVASGVLGIYTLAALDAELPWLAGAMMGCAWLSRPPVIWTAHDSPGGLPAVGCL